MKTRFQVKVRIVADSQEDCDAARAYLEALLGDRFSMRRGREGSNPKYAQDPKVLAYGELRLTAQAVHAKTRRRTRVPRKP